MDGMPRLPMISLEFKHPTSSAFPEFSLKIKEYILTHYEDDPAKYEAALLEMESLRAKLYSFTPDVETVCQAKRYYAQLRLMKSRFPMEEGDPIHISFSWTAKDSDGTTCSYDDVNFELACVMYNIGAIHAAIAAAENRMDSDSIKNAFTHFQCAAYPFQFIKDSMNVSRFSFVSDSSILTWLAAIMLAQAQECILEKSLIDHRKNTIVAKIATYLKEAYKQCAEKLRNSSASEFITSSKYKEWLRTCEIKCEVYDAISLIFLGDQAEQDQKMGARLLFYELAGKHVTAALKYAEKDKREGINQALCFISDVVTTKISTAKKDNDFIYHDRVPNIEELSMVEAVVMVKPIPFDSTDRSVSGDDLFAALLPMNVLKAVSVYSEEKAKFKRDVMEKIRVKDDELESYLLSLQLDEIGLDSDKIKLPDSLLEKSAAFNAKPDAFPELLDKLKRVSDYAVEAEDKLTNLRDRLAVIDLPELTSDDGFSAISREISKISEDHKKARENNTKLQKAIAMHSENLRLLAMPLAELTRHISGPIVKPSESEESACMKKLLVKVEEMKKQRKKLFDELCTDLENDDITTKCLAEKEFDNNELFKNELTKHEKMMKLIDLNLTAQTNILSALTEANANFAVYRKQVMNIKSSRKDQVLALTAAYEVYCNVLQKANEGLKFYSTLYGMVKTLNGAVEGVEEAYSAKKAEINKAKAVAEERAPQLNMNLEAAGQCNTGGCNITNINNDLKRSMKLENMTISQLPPVSGVQNAAVSYGMIMQPVQGTTTTTAIQQFGAAFNKNQNITTQPSLVSLPQNGCKTTSGAFMTNFPSWNDQVLPVATECRDPQTVYHNPYKTLNPVFPNASNIYKNTSQTSMRLLQPNQTVSSGAVGVPNLNVNSLQPPQTYINNFTPSVVGNLSNSCGGFTSEPTIHRPSIMNSGNIGISWQQNQQQNFSSMTYQSVQPGICNALQMSSWRQSHPGEVFPQPVFSNVRQLNTQQYIPSQVNRFAASTLITGQAEQLFPQRYSHDVPQQQIMDIMNSTPVPNLPEPLIPQKNVANM